MNAPEPDISGKRVWLIVARRDFWVRLRDKGFVISTALTMTVLTVFVLLKAYGGSGAETFRLAIVGERQGMTASELQAQARAAGATLTFQRFTDADAAKTAVQAGTADAALIDGTELIGNDAVPPPLAAIVETAASRHLIAGNLNPSLTPERVGAVLDTVPVAVHTIAPADPNLETNRAVAFVAVLLLYGQLFGYGIAVATGVIEEKASRIVEILLAAIKPRELLAGKVLGVGALGLLQLVWISIYAVVLASVTGAMHVPAHALGTIAISVGWFALGFAFYASLFAVAGALVARMEELQNAIVPINLLILASFFISIGAVQSPDTTTAITASLLPFSSALAMPVRIAVGSATLGQIVASLAILIASVAVLVPFAGRLYSNAVLRTGSRVKLREVWRATR
ncbi:MAG: type transport system permease protein [Actinomycetota bacterium]|nr:type transport system permease protein [Actinomycetota bacterium]